VSTTTLVAVLGHGVVADDPIESNRWRARFRRLPLGVWLAAILAAGLAIRGPGADA
jgi:hypothetical protein